MGNLEKPLTLALGLLFIIGLFIVNCNCGEGTTCTINDSFNISSSDINADAMTKEIKADIKKDDITLEVDNIVDTILEEAEGNADAEIEVSDGLSNGGE